MSSQVVTVLPSPTDQIWDNPLFPSRSIISRRLATRASTLSRTEELLEEDMDQLIAKASTDCTAEVTRALEVVLQKIYNKWNYAVLVNTLPEEMLCEIFRALDDGSIRKKLTIMHVCRYWRDIASSDPHMWRRLDLTTISCMHLSDLQRLASALPLELIYKDWSIFDRRKEAFIVANLATTSSLTLRFPSHENPIWLLDNPAPMLRQLSLETPPGGSSSLRRLFGDKHPCLTELVTTGTHLQWLPGRYRGLTRLQINELFVPRGSKSLFHDLRHVFEGCSDLQEVILNGSVPDSPSPPSKRTLAPVICLPKLRKMKLWLSGQDMHYVLSILDLPSAESIKLYYRNVDPNFRDFGAFSRSLTVLRKVSWLSVDRARLIMVGFPPHTRHADLEPCFHLGPLHLEDHEYFDNFLSSMGNETLPATSLAQLRYTWEPNTAQNNWPWDLRILYNKSITAVHFSGEPATVVRILFRELTLESTLFCPNLRQLAICDMHLTVDEIIKLSDIVHNIRPEMVSLILDCTAELPAENVEAMLSRKGLYVMHRTFEKHSKKRSQRRSL